MLICVFWYAKPMADNIARFRQRMSPWGGLTAAGYLNKGSDLLERVMDSYALVYLLEGGGWYADVGTGRTTLSAGDLLVLFPGLAHGYGPGESPRWSEGFLVFDGGVFGELERQGALDRRRPVLSPGLDPALTSVLDTLIGDFHAGRAGDDPVTVARVHLLVAESVERDRRARLGVQAGFAEAARARLEQHLDQALDLAAVAHSFGMSAETFRKRFVAAVGVPPARYRLVRRIDRAKSLLVEQGLSLAVVAERLGYCDQYFFARQFRQVTGRSPGRFRAEYGATSTRS